MASYFEMGTCPACKQHVDVAHEQYRYVTIQGKLCVVDAVKPDSPQAIFVIVHEDHVDRFKKMVADGSWSPAK